MCILLAVVVTVGAFPWAGAQHARLNGEQPNASAEPGNNFDGTWWLRFGPPPQRPLILTMTGGAFMLEDSLDGGGHLPTGSSFSLVQGTWTRNGPHGAKALGLRFVYNAARKTIAVERVRLSMSFLENFSRMQGQLQFEEMGCTERVSPLPFTVPVCPDPTTTPTQVLRGPAPFTGVRVPVDLPAM